MNITDQSFYKSFSVFSKCHGNPFSYHSVDSDSSVFLSISGVFSLTVCVCVWHSLTLPFSLLPTWFPISQHSRCSPAHWALHRTVHSSCQPPAFSQQTQTRLLTLHTTWSQSVAQSPVCLTCMRPSLPFQRNKLWLMLTFRECPASLFHCAKLIEAHNLVQGTCRIRCWHAQQLIFLITSYMDGVGFVPITVLPPPIQTLYHYIHFSKIIELR